MVAVYWCIASSTFLVFRNMTTVMEKRIDRMAKEVFSDFVTIAIHGLLHSCQVYPAGVFKLRQKFNIPVQVCYHPDVFSYISDVSTSIARIMDSQTLHAVHIFVGTPTVDWEQVTIRLHAFDAVKTQTELNDIQACLKSCLLKLSIIDSYFARRVTGDITWRVEIDANNLEVETNHSTNWARSDLASTRTQGPREPGAKDNIIPLKTGTTDRLKVELFVTRLQ